MRAGFAMGRSRPPRLAPRVEGSQLPGYVLYVITFVCQLLSAYARGATVNIGLKFVGVFSPWSIPALAIAWVVVVVPLVASLLCLICPPLICPIMGRWWEMEAGGRAPVGDERDVFEEAIEVLALEDPRFKAPRHWFVAEEDGYNAEVFANSMAVNRGLLESREATPAFISHEYQHLRSGDGRLNCARQMLVLWPMEKPALYPLRTLPLRGLLWVAGGQAVDWFLGSSWQNYWRSREYSADNYTIRVRQGPAFARSLRYLALPLEQPRRWMAFSTASHPYSMQRIARLEGPAEEPAGGGR